MQKSASQVTQSKMVLKHVNNGTMRIVQNWSKFYVNEEFDHLRKIYEPYLF